jgi:putative PIN family toxin of toxin-antitoxin system
MPSVVLDASTLVGALLRPGSVPERALLLARARATICLSTAVEQEIREVFGRPRFRKYLTPGRVDLIFGLLAAAERVEPGLKVTDCRDVKDNKYLELALAAGAGTIISSDADLLVLHPWRGVEIVTPARYVAQAVTGSEAGT